MMDPVRASFDRIAEQYAADFADELTRKPWDAERLRRFATACRPGPVLDVGCGPAGHVGRFLADLGARVVGVDFSERSVTHAKRLNPMLRFVAGDARALPIADRGCAGVVAFYSLIYGDDDWTAAALAELRRVLRFGGRLLVAVHAGAGAQRFNEYKGMAVDVELHYRQPAAFAALVRRAGFAVQAVEVRPPYAFEHATERLYVSARAG
jgi:SAM-dependent methyltransferase